MEIKQDPQAQAAMAVLKESGILNPNVTLDHVMNLANKLAQEPRPPKGPGGTPSTELRVNFLVHNHLFFISVDF